PGYVNQTIEAGFIADSQTLAFPGCNPNNDKSPRPSVAFREDILFTNATGGGYGLDINSASADPDITVLPPDIYGISTSGTNDGTVPIQSISISVDLNREEI